MKTTMRITIMLAIDATNDDFYILDLSNEEIN